MGNDTKYTPLNSRYPMSWAPDGCDWCGDAELAWAYPVGEVTFPRRVSADGKVTDVSHEAQPWFACGRCKSYLDADRWDELADVVGRPHGFWSQVRAARLHSRGYAWGIPRSRRRPRRP